MNVKAKKIFIAVLLVAVLTVLAAGAASARGWGGHRGGRGHMGGGYGYGPCAGGGYYGGGHWGRDYYDGPRGGGRGGYGYGPGGGYYDNNAYANELPQGIRDKIAEAQKIAIDLRIELDKTPVNRERALELHKKHGAIMQEISDWRFQQRFDENIPR